MIKRFEGYRRQAIQLPGGRWTLGYGHVQTARAGAEVSQEDAEALLLYDLIGVAHAVNEMTLAPLNQNQFDALCSFVFNIGAENYRGSSTLRRLNEGQMLQAAACMELWRKADVQGRRIVVDAIVRRRAAEKLLFLTPMDGWIPAPTPLLPPKVDMDAIEALAMEGASSLTDLLEGRTTVKAGSAPATPETAESASERAAAVVGARLEQIFADPEPSIGPALRLTPAPEFDFHMDPESETEAEAEPAERQPTLFDVAPAAARRDTPVVQPEGNPLERITMAGSHLSHPMPQAWEDAAGAAALAGLGLALAVGGLAWGFYARATESGLDPRFISWIGGLIGVSLMAFAAYLALRRLGGPDEN